LLHSKGTNLLKLISLNEFILIPIKVCILITTPFRCILLRMSFEMKIEYFDLMCSVIYYQSWVSSQPIDNDSLRNLIIYSSTFIVVKELSRLDSSYNTESPSLRIVLMLHATNSITASSLIWLYFESVAIHPRYLVLIPL